VSSNGSDYDYDYVYPDGWQKKPVNWITYEEASLYCEWSGKRLPNDWEWQYAAQGGKSQQQYPWGDVFDYSAIPQYDGNRNTRPLDDVDAHVPKGLSSWGLPDLFGNAWEMTNVFENAHTRSMLIRGSSFFYPQGSGWYLRQVSNLLQHQRILLMSPPLDRSSMIKFRCVKDSLTL